MKNQIISIKKTFHHGFQIFSDNPVPAIFGCLLFSIITFVGNLIPFLNIGFTIFLAAPLTGGMAILALKLVLNDKPMTKHIFDGFRNYGQFMGAYWLLCLVTIIIWVIAAIPFGIAVLACELLDMLQGKAFHAGHETIASIIDYTIPVIGIVVIAVSVITAIMLSTRFLFTLLIVADKEQDLTVIESLKESNRITKGKLVQLALNMIVLGLFATAGVLAGGIGIFITTPIVWCSIAWIYTKLKMDDKAGNN